MKSSNLRVIRVINKNRNLGGYEQQNMRKTVP